MYELALRRIEENKTSYAKYLDLTNCRLTVLPESLFDCTWLEDINLSYNQLSPIELARLAFLPLLSMLNLSNNDLNDIENMPNLPQLTTLDLSRNQLADIRVFLTLPQLIDIDLSYNCITSTSFLRNLFNLKYINLENNQLYNLDGFSHLSELRSANLSHNILRDTCKLVSASKLKSLNLSYNELTSTSGLENFYSLETLDLSHNELTNVKGLLHAPQLNDLNLRYNRLIDLSIFPEFPYLTSLDLNNNQLVSLSGLKNNVQLQILDLSDNNLVDLKSIPYLPNLKTLDASRNKLISIRIEMELRSLITVDFRYNFLANTVGIDRMPFLQNIDLRRNSIVAIDELAKLEHIATIRLNGNPLRDLSPLFSLIRREIPAIWDDSNWRGNGIYIEDCPLIDPPIDIAEQGSDAILNFLRQIDEQGGTVPLYEAKLIMVGEPGAGKTSLTEKLIDEQHNVIPDDPKKKSTIGINVRENWRFADHQREDEIFTAHIWDFGGQEIQYMTHQFFLTPESFYVLVADDRKQHTLFPYWFEVIQLLGKDEFGNNSPVLVVLNERSHKSITNFDLNAYREKYIDLRIEVMEVDLSDTNLHRFRGIREKIQHSLCSLDHIGRRLPRMWSPIRQAIIEHSRHKNHLTESEYADICTQFRVTRLEDRQLISRYLHRLGVILHFQDDIQLRDFIIINPSWALKAVYAILEDKAVQQRYGQFTEGDLDKRWHDLTSDERAKILNLMKRDNFEICYPVEKEYIAPQLLPQVRPLFDWNANKSLKCHFFYRFMPKGIMTRLIVRKHEWLAQEEGLVWARGAMFKYVDCTVLVTEEETERNGLIAIEVNGTAGNRIRALNFIRDEIEAIHKKWFRSIDYEERAPCTCENCFQSQTPTFFSWKKLSQRVEENRETIECDNGRIKDVPVIPLLEGIYDQSRIAAIQRGRYASWTETEYQVPAIDRGPTYSPISVQPVADITPTQIPVNHNTMKSPELPKWFVTIILLLTVALTFYIFAKPGSKLDFLWLKAEQGSEQKASKLGVENEMATVIGTIKINNRNAQSNQVNAVYVKGETAGPRATLDGNTFRLRNVRIAKDRLITIAIDLPSHQSASQQFIIPEPDSRGVADLGEILLEVSILEKPSKQHSERVNSKPTIIINNQNIQKN